PPPMNGWLGSRRCWGNWRSWRPRAHTQLKNQKTMSWPTGVWAIQVKYAQFQQKSLRHLGGPHSRAMTTEGISPNCVQTPGRGTAPASGRPAQTALIHFVISGFKGACHAVGVEQGRGPAIGFELGFDGGQACRVGRQVKRQLFVGLRALRH